MVAFLSFDISGIPGSAAIQQATLDLRHYDVLGNPFGKLGKLHVRDIQYGNTLESADISVTGTEVWLLAAPPLVSRDVTAAVRQRKLEGRTRFQLSLRFDLNTNSDSIADVIRFDSNKVTLTVTYQ